ncbi:MAG: hypothetical protein ACI4P4_07560, partial [Faecousia sp.]
PRQCEHWLAMTGKSAARQSPICRFEFLVLPIQSDQQDSFLYYNAPGGKSPARIEKAVKIFRHEL